MAGNRQPPGSPISGAKELALAHANWQREEADPGSTRKAREAAQQTVEDVRKRITAEAKDRPAEHPLEAAMPEAPQPGLPRQLTEPVPSSLGAAAIVAPQAPLKRDDILKVADTLHSALVSKPQAYLEAARVNLAAAIDRITDPALAGPKWQRRMREMVGLPVETGFTPERAEAIHTDLENRLLPASQRPKSELTPVDQAIRDNEILPVHKQIEKTTAQGRMWSEKLGLTDEQDHELRMEGPPRMRLEEAAFIQRANEGTPLSRRQLGDSSMFHGRKNDVLEAPDGRRWVIRRGPKTFTVLHNNKVYKPIDETAKMEYEKTKVDIDGEPWTYRAGTTKEIEAGEHLAAGGTGKPPSRYLKNPLLIAHYTLATTRANTAKLEALWHLKNNLENKRIIVGASVAPKDWATTKFPGLAGYKVHPRLAEVLDDFMNRRKGTTWEKIEDAAHALTGTLFWSGGLPHFLNVFAHVPFTAGWRWFDPKFMGRDWGNAFNDVARGSELYRKVLAKGGPLFFSTTRNENFPRRFMQKFGHEIVRDPVGTGAAAWAKQFGLTAKELAQGYGRAMNGGLWFGSDMIAMQQVRAHMRVFMARGMTEDQALGHAMQKIHDLPTYRTPPRLWEGWGGREATQFLRYTPVNVFGRYHYSIAESFGRLAKDLAVGDKKTKIEAVGKVAALASLYMAWKGYDAWVQKTSPRDKYGNRLEASYPGLMGPVKTAEDWITGRNRSGMEVARHLGFSPSPAAQIAGGLFMGQDIFGREIARPGATLAERGAQYADYALEQVPIVGEVLPRGEATGRFLGGLGVPLEMGQLRLRKEPPPGGWAAAAEKSPFKGQRDVGPVEALLTGRRYGTKPKRKIPRR